MNQAEVPVSSEQIIDRPMRILMAGSCPSLSGLSDISFLVACPEGAKDVSSTCFKIAGNSSSGKFNAKWVSIADIERCISDIPSDQAFSASAWKSLYLHGSTNSPGFLAAILLHVAVIARVPDKQLYVRHTATAFWESVGNLIAAGTDLPVPAMGPSAASKEAAPAKPPKSAKKSAAPATT